MKISHGLAISFLISIVVCYILWHPVIYNVVYPILNLEPKFWSEVLLNVPFFVFWIRYVEPKIKAKIDKKY